MILVILKNWEKKMKVKYKLLSTTDCPKCPAAKDMLDVHKVEYEYLLDDEAIEVAQSVGVMTVPTVVDYTNEDNPAVYNGINEIQRFMDAYLKRTRGPGGEILE